MIRQFYKQIYKTDKPVPASFISDINVILNKYKDYDINYNVNIMELIKKKRKELAETSLMAYDNSLNYLYRNLTGKKGKPIDYSFIKNVEGINRLLSSKKPNTRKNYYSVLVVTTDALGDEILKEKYDLEMRKNLSIVKESEGIASESQKKNMITLEEYDNILNDFKYDDIWTYQDYILLLFYRYLPLRNDLADMKVININDLPVKSKENFLVVYKDSKYKLHLNSYKTSKTLGSQVIDIPDILNEHIRKFLTYNRTGFFIIKRNLKPVTPNMITKMLNRIFMDKVGKKISTSLIRHIFLTSKYKKDLEEREKDSKIMLHSTAMQQSYIFRS